MKKTIFSLFILILFIPKTSFAEEIDVTGYLYDTNDKPLSGVLVSTKDDYKIHTDETEADGSYGFYLFGGLLAQKYTLTYSKEGYETQTKDIDLTDVSPYGEDYQVERITMVSTTDGTITGTWEGNYTMGLSA